MASFEIAHKKVARNEGGYTNHPDDNGNWTGGKKGVGKLIGTKYGISAPTLKAYLKREPTVEDMKNLSKQTADLIYKNNYWNPLRADEIINQALANEIYDMSVNAGVSAGIKLAENVVGLPNSKAAKMYDTLLNKLNGR